MSTWSLPQLLSGLHENIEHRLEIARKTFGHPGTKGDGSENVWLELFQTYLPTRYQAERAHVVDSRDRFSQQLDVVIFDRHYSPFIFDMGAAQYTPLQRQVESMSPCLPPLGLFQSRWDEKVDPRSRMALSYR